MPHHPPTPCPICDAPAPVLMQGFAGYRAPDRYDIHECDKCDLQFASPFRSDTSIYEAIYRQPERLSGYARYHEYGEGVLHAADPLAHLRAAEAMYWFVARAAADLDPDRSCNILEVGCGLGYLTYALRQAGHEARGLDISAQAVERARRAFGDHYLCADVNQFAAEAPGAFDIVVMTEVLEHLERPLQVLRSLRALLRPNGSALISTPSKDFLPLGAVWRTDNPPVHLAWYSAASLREMARRTGFRIRFADFTEFNRGRVAGIAHKRDLAGEVGAFRLSPEDAPLDRLSEPSASARLIDALPPLRRRTRRRKFVRRALELYAERSEVLGAIFERCD